MLVKNGRLRVWLQGRARGHEVAGLCRGGVPGIERLQGFGFRAERGIVRLRDFGFKATCVAPVRIGWRWRDIPGCLAW